MIGSGLFLILFLILGSQFAVVDATTWDYRDKLLMQCGFDPEWTYQSNNIHKAKLLCSHKTTLFLHKINCDIVVSIFIDILPYRRKLNHRIFLDTNWNASYPLCGGTMQSPINIEKNSTTAANYSDFAFSVGYKTAMMGTISNTGYSSMLNNN